MNYKWWPTPPIMRSTPNLRGPTVPQHATCLSEKKTVQKQGQESGFQILKQKVMPFPIMDRYASNSLRSSVLFSGVGKWPNHCKPCASARFSSLSNLQMIIHPMHRHWNKIKGNLPNRHFSYSYIWNKSFLGLAFCIYIFLLLVLVWGKEGVRRKKGKRGGGE